MPQVGRFQSGSLAWQYLVSELDDGLTKGKVLG